jgi:hypothetical protein
MELTDRLFIAIKENFIVPKSKTQKVIFSALMALVMVYGMETYNHIIAKSPNSFGIPLLELVGLMAVVILLQELIAGRLAREIVFKIINPAKGKLPKVVINVQIATVLLMCPMMSFVAALVFKANIDMSLIKKWLNTFVVNLPMAMSWQLLVAGPIVRGVVKKIPS